VSTRTLLDRLVENEEAVPLHAGRCQLKPVPKGKFNRKQLKMGTKEEREHTYDKKTAERIAKQHLASQGAPKDQDYYSRLKKYVEPKAKAMLLALPQSSSTPTGP
jgi:hypothetical protein